MLQTFLIHCSMHFHVYVVMQCIVHVVLCMHAQCVQFGTVKLTVWRHLMHAMSHKVWSVTSDSQSLCNKLYVTVYSHAHICAWTYQVALTHMHASVLVKCADLVSAQCKLPPPPSLPVIGHVLFFLCFSSLFFFTKPTRAREKKNKMPKEKKTLAQCPRLPDRQMTNRTNCVVRSYSFVYFFTKQWSWFQSPRKFNFSWYLTSLRGQRTCSNLQLKRSSTLQMHSSCRDRSLDGKLDRGLDSRQNTYPDVFVKARPHYYQQSLHSMISTERILAFGFQWQDSVTRLLPPISRKRVLRCFQSFGECAWMASIMLFRIMVWDVHPIIYLHPTTEKEKVLRVFLLAITVKTTRVCKCNVQVLRAWHRRSIALILWSSVFFFFLVFSQELHGRVRRNIEKKAHGRTVLT